MQFNYSPCRESGTRTRIPVAPDHVGFQLPHFSFSVSAPSGLAITGSRTSENCTSFPQRVFSTTNVSFLRSDNSSYAKSKQSGHYFHVLNLPIFQPESMIEFLCTFLFTFPSFIHIVPNCEFFSPLVESEFALPIEFRCS